MTATENPENVLTQDVQRNPLFIDVVYGKYVAMIQTKQQEADNVIYLD